MFRRAAVLVAALLASLPRVGAADEPSSQWKYDNPFCQVVAAVVPIPGVVASTAAVGDSYSIDRTSGVTCPSYVFPIGPALSSAPAGLRLIGYSIKDEIVQSSGELKYFP